MRLGRCVGQRAIQRVEVRQCSAVHIQFVVCSIMNNIVCSTVYDTCST